jgi:hypothetical protein
VPQHARFQVRHAAERVDRCRARPWPGH